MLQVQSGMSGVIIVEGLLDPFPSLNNISEKIFVLKDIDILPNGTIPTNSDAQYINQIYTTNGVSNPTIQIQPDELQIWKIANTDANLAYNFTFSNDMTFWIVAKDGQRQNQLINATGYYLTPAARLEILVRGPADGVYTMYGMNISTGPAGDMYPGGVLVTLNSTGTPVSNPIPLPTNFPAVIDLQTYDIANERLIALQEDANYFYINNRTFDPNRIDTIVTLGTVEKWNITNFTNETHAFHLHQGPFQVLKIEGVPIPFTGYQDTQSIPYVHEDGTPGVVEILIPFLDSYLLGTYMYHCHIMEHEQGGMMAAVKVVAPVTTGTTGSEETMSTSSNQIQQSTHAGSSLPSGALAAIIVEGVALLVAIVVITVLVLRRRTGNRNPDAVDMPIVH